MCHGFTRSTHSYNVYTSYSICYKLPEALRRRHSRCDERDDIRRRVGPFLLPNSIPKRGRYFAHAFGPTALERASEHLRGPTTTSRRAGSEGGRGELEQEWSVGQTDAAAALAAVHRRLVATDARRQTDSARRRRQRGATALAQSVEQGCQDEVLLITRSGRVSTAMCRTALYS